MSKKNIGGALTPLTLLFLIPVAHADLTDQRILSQLSPLEQRAAFANQAVYNQLTRDPDGPNGAQAPICPTDPATGGVTCSGGRQQIFENVRELVETSNELTGNGPTTHSLGVDAEGLGFALRWTAAEELAAQGSSATQVSNNQLNSLASRISALRFGARGLRASRDRDDNGTRVAGVSGARGGGAAADDDSIAKRWGGFIDGSYGYGRKGDTTFSNEFEDAFDYDGQEITGGVDYRLKDSVVIGALLGYSKKEIDFDSRVSIVDGTIKSDGMSFMGYGLWEADKLYVSGSLGGQWLNHDLVRRITYPSLNPLVSSVNETASSSADSFTLLATFNVGYGLRFGGLTVEPFIKGEYQKLTIDAFTEHGAHGFDFDFGEQDIESFDTALGLKLQYALTPRWGVIVPYARAEFHKQFDNNARVINAVYSGVEGITLAPTAGDPNFALRTDEPDNEFVLASAGFSVVLKRGLQGFIQYQQAFDLDTYKDHAITGGIRLEL